MLITLVLTSLLINAPAEKREAPPSVMYQFLYHVTEIQAFASSNEGFKSKKNHKVISEHLAALADLSKNLSQHDRLEDPVFKMMAKRLTYRLQQTSLNFKDGRKEFSRRLFHESLDGCSSCHSQVKSSPEIQFQFDESKIKGSAFEKAEFWYAVRQYEKALKLYEESIRTYSSKEPLYTLDTSLKKIASILVRVYLDLDRAQFEFIKISTQKNFPPQIKDKLKVWAASAARLAESGLSRKKYQSADKLNQLAKTLLERRKTSSNIADADLVEILFVSGLIYDYVHKTDKLDPQLLLNLAKCEQMLENEFLLSVSGLYLRRCIIQFPSSETAQACFNEYKSQMELEFTGSGGVNLPPDVQEDLKQLQSLLKPAKKENK